MPPSKKTAKVAERELTLTEKHDAVYQIVINDLKNGRIKAKDKRKILIHIAQVGHRVKMTDAEILEISEKIFGPIRGFDTILRAAMEAPR